MYSLALITSLSVLCPGAPSQDRAPVEPLWEFQASGQIWSSAAQADGVLYFGSDDNCLYALDASGPSLEWRHATGGRIRSTPALDEDSVVFGSDDGFLYSLKRADGSEEWRFDLGGAGVSRTLPSPHPPYEYDYLQSSPLLMDGVVHVGSADGSLYAVDAATGEERWRFETGARIRSSPRASGDAVYVGSWDGHLYCLDRKTGRERWKVDTGGILQASPTIADGLVFIGSRNPKIFALDAETGELVWEYVHRDGSWVESTGVWHDGILYVGSSDAFALFALDAATGELLWRFETGGWSWCTPAIDGDTVLIGCLSAEPYYEPDVTLERGLWAVDRLTGEELWHLPAERIPGYVTGGVIATPAIVDGIAYFGSLDGAMIATRLEPAKGSGEPSDG